jgi:RNA polymerase sigma-70 factor (ECF subfamily)
MRGRNFDALLAVLDPDVVRRADHAAVPSEAAREIRGAAAVIKEALTHTDRARFARSALVNGSVGIVVAPRGRLLMVLRCTVKGGKIVEFEVVADPARLRQFDLAVLHDGSATR